MSNNAPDYKNNLAFPPRHDETAYELQLKVNKLEKQLNKAEDILHELSHGHQSRNAYNDLISMARIYFEELDK